MKKLSILMIALVLAAVATPLFAAAVANFQGNCNGSIPTPCYFDANRAPVGEAKTSCAPSTVSIYFWDFNSTITGEEQWTTNPVVTYTYPGTYCDFVTMAVFCNNGMSATKTRCLCNTFGVGGCIRPGAGWTP